MTLGEKALKEVSEMLSTSAKNRQHLMENGWERVLDPPLVGNEWIWQHPTWKVQLQSQALRILDGETN